MLDPSRGTSDDDGETRDDARVEVAAFFASAPHPLLRCSWAATDRQELIGACLVVL